MKAKNLHTPRFETLLKALVGRMVELSRLEPEVASLPIHQDLQMWLVGEVIHMEMVNQRKPVEVMVELMKGHAYCLWKQDCVMEPVKGKLKIEALQMQNHHIQVSLSGGHGQFGALHDFEGDALSPEAVLAQALYDVHRENWTKQYLRDYWIMEEKT